MRYVATAAVLAALAGCAQSKTPAAPTPATAAASERLPAGKQDLLSLYVDTEAIGRERALTHYRLALEKADKAMQGGEFDRAAEAARDALSVLDANRQYLGEGEATAMREQAKAAAAKVEAVRAAWDEKKAAERYKAETAEIRRAQRQQRVAQAVEEGKKFAEQRRYIEAMDSLRQALVLDPTHEEARQLYRQMSDTLGYRTDAQLHRKKAMENTQQGLQSQEALIPYSEPLTYPEDWVEKTRERQ